MGGEGVVSEAAKAGIGEGVVCDYYKWVVKVW